MQPRDLLHLLVISLRNAFLDHIPYLRCYVTPVNLLTIPYALDGLGYLKILAPPEKILRWIEGKLNLLGRLPHYVSIDQKTYGRYGLLPTTNAPSMDGAGEGSYMGSTERLGP